MISIRLWPQGEGPVNTIDLIVPQEENENIGNAGTVSFRDKEYTFAGIVSGRLNFREAGPVFDLKEEWVHE